MNTDLTPFEALFLHASVGIIICDENGIMEQVNPFAASIFGYEVEDMIGQKIEILLPHKMRAKHVGQRDSYNQSPKNRAMGAGIDLVAVRKDQTEFPVEISLSYYRIGGRLQVVSFINDITERKRSKEKLRLQALELEAKVDERTKELSEALVELNHTNDNLEVEIANRKNIEIQVRAAFEKERELNELKSRFVSMASHEFRTPLGGILTSASLLEKYQGSEQQTKREKHIQTIKKSVKNLTSILNDFLSVDKLEQGNIGAHPSSFPLVETIKNFLNDVQDLAVEDRNIIFDHSGEDVTMFQDKDMLRNILINLLSNAIKYSPPSKPITVRTTILPDNWLQMEIQDEGVGIPEADQKNLFERFFRASNVTTVQGTGLGLTIVTKYLDFMGGSIDFKSKENVGTTFILRIPLEIKQ